MDQWKLPSQKPEEEDGESVLDTGFFDYNQMRYMKFGNGSTTLAADVNYGLWAGNDIYDMANFKISNTGTITYNMIDGGTEKASPGTVSIWFKITAGGTTYYVPGYTTKT